LSSAAAQKLTLRQRVFLIGLGLVLAFILVEASLQVAAFVHRMQRPPSSPEGESRAASDTYRVLCLGESTTAAFFGVVAYDRILERLLNQRGFGTRFRVINAGYSAKHTSFLVEQLPELLEEHDPHMVILMMGINDHLYFDEPDRLALPIGLQRQLFRSRTYRLLRILKQRLSSDSEVRATVPLDDDHLKIFQDMGREVLETRAEDGPTPEVEEGMRSLIWTAREVAHTGQGGTIFDVPEPYLPFYQKAHEWLAGIYLSSGREEAAVDVFRDAIQRHPESEYFHRKLGGIYDELGKTELAQEYLRRSEELAMRRVLSVTKANYRTATEILQDRGIQVVAMQYPMRSVETLSYLLTGAEDVLFVDNQATFRDAVARYGYDALFRDRFAGDFGHCTRRGNRLIAENLVATVFEPLFGH
jgi:lysophospholipase L1-like esterase